MKDGFVGRSEALEEAGRRRDWPDEVKAQIVLESLAPGARVVDVARRHRLPPSQLTTWRRPKGMDRPRRRVSRRWRSRGRAARRRLRSGSRRVWRSWWAASRSACRGRPRPRAWWSAPVGDGVGAAEQAGMIVPGRRMALAIALRPVDFRRGADVAWVLGSKPQARAVIQPEPSLSLAAFPAP